MMIKDLSFRELDRKWFLVENYKELKKINRLFRFKRTHYPIVGYTYIDHEAGISMRVLGTIEVIDGCANLNKKNIEERMDLLRYSEMEKLEVQLIDSDMVKNINYTDIVEEEMDGYYSLKDKIIEARKDTRLDDYRDPVLVDDVKFLIVDEKHKAEFAWARIEDYDKESDIFTCSLVTETKQDFDLSIDDKILLKYVERPKYTGLAYLKRKIEDGE